MGAFAIAGRSSPFWVEIHENMWYNNTQKSLVKPNFVADAPAHFVRLCY